MSFTEAVKTCFRKYASFSGRARRREYWYFALFQILISIPLIIAEVLLPPMKFLVYAVDAALFLPGLAVAVRRLHDTGRSGLHLLVLAALGAAFAWLPDLVPSETFSTMLSLVLEAGLGIAGLYYAFWFYYDSDRNENKYGPCPKSFEAEDNPETADVKTKPQKKVSRWFIAVGVIFLIVIIGIGIGTALSGMDTSDSVETLVEAYIEDATGMKKEEETVETVTYDDGSYDEVQYNGYGHIAYLYHYDADGVLTYDEYYADGELTERDTYSKDGSTCSADSYVNGAYTATTVWNYYDNSTVKSIITTNADGIVTDEDYYEEDGSHIGEVWRDEATGEVTYSWGVDLDGNDLTVLYPAADES